MAVHTSMIELNTKKEGEVIDITDEVAKAVKESGLRNGVACIFSPSSTSAITTIEYEPGLLQDLPRALDRLFPRNIVYEHEERWHDGNGHSHVRAAFLGPSLTVPFGDGRPILGTWQQIVFVELDIKKRRRSVIVQALGE